jgi:hypothetical protein
MKVLQAIFLPTVMRPLEFAVLVIMVLPPQEIEQNFIPLGQVEKWT